MIYYMWDNNDLGFWNLGEKGKGLKGE